MTSLKKPLILLCAMALSATLLFAAAGDGLWMTKVPDKDRNRSNPFDGAPAALGAGGKLYRQNCASCHGDNALGRDGHPSLRTERVRAATPGELQWLLTNGSMKNGMPSWSRLPEQQRWQIVSYVKSLQEGK